MIEVVHRPGTVVGKDRWVLRDFDRGDQAAVRVLVLEGLQDRWGDAFDASMNPGGMGSTGAPLPAEGFAWVYEAVNDDVLLSSISGGNAGVHGVRQGVPPGPGARGRDLVPLPRHRGGGLHRRQPAGDREQRELVITAPMRSMPVGSWGDDDGSRDRAPYFERHPGVWTRGDWITLFPDGASVITGRSDATLTGADPDTAASRGSLANREVLDAHTGLAE